MLKQKKSTHPTTYAGCSLIVATSLVGWEGLFRMGEELDGLGWNGLLLLGKIGEFELVVVVVW